MTEERQRNDQSVFEVARLIESAAARADYVSTICRGDQAQAERIFELLRAFDASKNFLESPPFPVHRQFPSPKELQPGSCQLIGPYKLLQLIGEGGMGVVYMAEQTQPVKRKVALKLIKPGVDSRQVIARFEAERQALAIMDHVNIARVLDAGTTTEEAVGVSAGIPYFVMELIHGVPITRYCDDNHLTTRQRIELFVPVCQAIQHAHQKGIIHRDIKPSNVMVTLYDGRPVPKIIDFGVAKAVEQTLTERTLFTQYGTIVGTLEYMSPEQAEMSALGVDTRSDVYSLGVVLYELLTGSTPLNQSQMKNAGIAEVLRLIREEDPPKLSTRLGSSGNLLTTISAQRRTDPARLTQLMRGELDWIVMKTLEKDRNRRYETVDGFSADLLRYLNDEPVTACPPSLSYRLRKFTRKFRLQVVAALIIAVALVLGIITTTISMFREREAREIVNTVMVQRSRDLREQETALIEARDRKRDADEILLQAYLAWARGIRSRSRPGQRFESLEILQKARDLARTLNLPDSRFSDLRTETTAALALSDLRPEMMIPVDPEQYGCDFDGTHQFYAWTDYQGNCIIRRLSEKTVIAALPGRNKPAIPYFSEDGRYLTVIHMHFERNAFSGVAAEIWSLNVGTGTPRQILSDHDKEHVRRIAYHPRSHQAALAYNDGSIRLFDLASGRPIGPILAPNSLNREIELALHPSEPLIAVCSYFGSEVQVRNLASGDVVLTIPEEKGASDVAWHPNGKWLATAAGQGGRIRIHDRFSQQLIQNMQSNQDGIQIAFNHAGDCLVSNGWQNRIELFDIVTGQLLITANGLLSHFSADDQTLAGAHEDNRMGIWEVSKCREFRKLVRSARPNAKFLAAALHPDGRIVAAGMDDGFGIWDLSTGQELAFASFGEFDEQVTDVLFEPSGSLLTTGLSGLHRWPLRPDPESNHCILVGPPERLFPMAKTIVQCAKTGMLVANSRDVGHWHKHAGTWILNTDPAKPPIRIDAGPEAEEIAISPDGEFLLTATLSTGQTTLWSTRDGTLIRQLPDPGAYHFRFSSDGRWLSCARIGGGVLYDVETWQSGIKLQAPGVFSPDSQSLAVQSTPSAVSLIDRTTGNEFARLESPEFGYLHGITFSGDGTKLMGRSAKLDAIHVWDLGLIRRSLKERDLDWNYPEFTAAPDLSGIAAFTEARIDLGQLARPALNDDQRAIDRIEAARMALENDPNNAVYCNQLAWAYLTAPVAHRQNERALPLAEKAVQGATTADELVAFRNTLALAFYRNGRWSEAVTCLEPNLRESSDSSLAGDVFLMSMCCCRLGEVNRARSYLVWGNRWCAVNSIRQQLQTSQLEEIHMLRDEAEELLRAETPKTIP